MAKAKWEAARLNRARAGQNSSPHEWHQTGTLHFRWDNHLYITPLWIGGKIRWVRSRDRQWNTTGQGSKPSWEKLFMKVKGNAQSIQSPQALWWLLPAWWRPWSQHKHQCPTRTSGSLEEPQRGLGAPLPCLRWKFVFRGQKGLR